MLHCPAFTSDAFAAIGAASPARLSSATGEHWDAEAQQEILMRKTNKIFLTASLCAWLAGAASSSLAAGGHFAVDDAAILEPGQCQLETWFDRETERAQRLLHVGPACRLGAVEVGLNIDRVRQGTSSTSTILAPQVKWALALTEQIGIGLIGVANAQDRSPRYLGSTLVVPVSIQVSEQWLVHVNVGRDFRAEQTDGNRAGAALEWAPNAIVSVIGEHFREDGATHRRLGGRWNLTQATSLDLSRAQSLGARPPAWWTLGLNTAY